MITVNDLINSIVYYNKQLSKFQNLINSTVFKITRNNYCFRIIRPINDEDQLYYIETNLYGNKTFKYYNFTNQEFDNGDKGMSNYSKSIFDCLDVINKIEKSALTT